MNGIHQDGKYLTAECAEHAEGYFGCVYCVHEMRLLIDDFSC